MKSTSWVAIIEMRTDHFHNGRHDKIFNYDSFLVYNLVSGFQALLLIADDLGAFLGSSLKHLSQQTFTKSGWGQYSLFHWQDLSGISVFMA